MIQAIPYTLLLALVASNTDTTGRISMDQFDEHTRQSLESDQMEEHLDFIEEHITQHVDDFEFLWRAARSYSYTAEKYMLEAKIEVVRQKRSEGLEAMIDAENDVPEKIIRRVFELGKRGRVFAKRAAALQPHRVEGHYYVATNLATYVLGLGVVQVLAEGIYGEYSDALEASVKIDPGFARGGPLRIKSRTYFVLPWPIRDMDKSAEWMEKSLSVAPKAIRNLMFMGDCLWKKGRRGDAIEYYSKAIKYGHLVPHGVLIDYLKVVAQLKRDQAIREVQSESR